MNPSGLDNMGGMNKPRPVRNLLRRMLGDHDERIASERVQAENPPRPMTATELADVLEWDNR